MKHILKGNFVLSWFVLAQSLTVAPQNLITVYQASSSPSEFHNAIIKLKPPARKKENATNTVSESIEVGEERSYSPPDPGIGVDVQDDHTVPPDRQISASLEAEVFDLRATLTAKDRQIADLQDLLKRKNQEFIVLEEGFNSLRKFLGKVRVNLEIKTNYVTLFEMISKEEWVYDKKFGNVKVGNRGAEISG